MLVDNYSKKIFNLAYQFAGNQQEAEDLTQDIFLKLFNSLDRYNFNHDFTAWLLTLARNYLIDEYRKRRREKSQRTEIEEAALLADDQDLPESRYLDQEKSELIRKALQLLSPELRTIIVLREIEGFSYEEIASRLKLPLGTIKSRINRARIQMAEAIIKKSEGNYGL